MSRVIELRRRQAHVENSAKATTDTFARECFEEAARTWERLADLEAARESAPPTQPESEKDN